MRCQHDPRTQGNSLYPYWAAAPDHYEWAYLVQCLPPNTGEQQREQEHVVGEEWLILLPGNILMSPSRTKERRDNKDTEHGSQRHLWVLQQGNKKTYYGPMLLRE